jgi:hypothetical protein
MRDIEMILKLLLGIPSAILAGLVVLRVYEREIGFLISLLSLGIAFLAMQPFRHELTLTTLSIALGGVIVAALIQQLSLWRVSAEEQQARQAERLDSEATSTPSERLESRRTLRRARRPANRAR